MRARNREINVFSVSTLDVFCGAMGAFLIIMLSLLGQSQAAAEAAASGEAAGQAQQQLDLATAQQESFTVVAFWQQEVDVDLTVAYGDAFAGPKPSGPAGRSRDFAIPDTRGAGSETFTQRVVNPGDRWVVEVGLASPSPRGAVVYGTATMSLRTAGESHNTYTWTFGPTRLGHLGQRRTVLAIGVGDDRVPRTLPEPVGGA